MKDLAASPTSTASRGSGPMAGVARGSAINLIGGAFAGVATFLLTILLTRSLPADAVGAFFSVTSLFLLLTTLGQLGTGTGIVYFLARQDPESRRSTGPSYLRVAAGPVFVVAVVTGALMIALADPLASLLGVDGQSGVVPAMWVLGLGTPLAAALNLYTSATRGLGTMRATAVLDQIVRPTLQVVLVAAALFTDSWQLVVLAWVVPYLPSAVASRWWWHRDLGRGGPPGIERVPGLTGTFWRFTGPRALAGVAQLAMQRLDIVLVGAMAGLREAAVYTAATRFLVVGQLVGTAISRAVQPRLARAIGAGERDVTSELYQTATAWLVLLAWPLYLVMALASSTLLSLFGADYTVGAPVVVILSLTMLVATGSGMVDMVLIMAGKTSWNLGNVLFAFTVNLVADILLIPPYGITGAAIGWAAAILCANLVPLAQVRFALKLHPFGRGTLVAMALSAGCFGALPGVVLLTTGSSLWILLPTLALCTLVWGAGVWWTRHTLDLTSLVAGLRDTPAGKEAKSLS
ncbi:MAG: oligosaccharide flippase family protein [Marmoricola sp.]